MKKIILLSTLFFFSLQLSISTQAQTLYGTTPTGGNGGGGTINKYMPATNDLTVVKSLEGYQSHPQNPGSNLIQASDGKLYGMTTNGGSSHAGVIFSFDTSTSAYTKLKDFNNTDGSNPYGSLIQATDGKLYGMTNQGGSSGYGVIFSFDPSSLIYTKLKEFNGTNGARPGGSLIQASDGKLYGMTGSGGNKDAFGVIFSFDLSSSTYTKLKEFDGTNGRNPIGSLIQASDGKLYGMTLSGGGIGWGVIFSFDPLSSKYSKLKDFDGINGAYPYGSLMQANDGKLYGMTHAGGTGSVGVIFSFDPYSSTYTKRKDFTIINGGHPTGNLIQARDGKLYGITNSGGSSYVDEDNEGSGVIFSFDPSSSIYTNLHDFSYPEGGGDPDFRLMQASNGKLYGMTQGSDVGGVIFSFDASSLIYILLIDFSRTDENGYNLGNVMHASDGKLYGVANQGGRRGYGVIFSFDPSSSNYIKLKDFDDANGSAPFGGSLIQATDGKLYGMTNYGGSNGVGVIFSFDPSSSTYTKLKDFDNINGAYPSGSLIQAKDGKLYGMTPQGGSNGYGAIFSFNPSSQAYTKLKDFDDTNGSHPYGNLMQASDGKLYGMTNGGGSSSLGVIFSFDPLSSIYTKLKDYNGTNGGNPSIGSVFIEVGESNKAPVVNIASPANDTTYTAYGFTKIILNADASDAGGTINKVEFYNGSTLLHTENVAPYRYFWHHVPAGIYTITAKATDNDGNVTISNAVHISVVPDKAPTVNVTSPANGATYTAWSSMILSADANDVDGTIKKVDFYNGNKFLFTETVAPYRKKWHGLPVGNYTFTAKATDNNGRTTTSLPVMISVVPDIDPTINITSPADNTTYVSPATIILSADANDVDGTIKKVEFYNGSTLLFTENDAPYFRSWPDVPEGNYSITAKATDNNGKITTSAPVVISVVAASRSLVKEDKLNSSKEPLSLNLNPNPVASILNISVHGQQTNNISTILVLSVSGAVIKTIQPGALNKNVQLDVSSLSGGVYFIKVINGDQVLHKQFIKL